MNDITQTINLKPFRDYDPHEIINGFFAFKDGATVDANRGTFVSIVANTVNGNTNVFQKNASPATPLLGMTVATAGNGGRRFTMTSEVTWKVKAADAGEPVLGVLLDNVRTTSAFGESYLYNHELAVAHSVIPSGQSVPILKRGLIKTNGFSGSPVANSLATCNNGILVPGATAGAGGIVGMFLTGPDADGYAIFDIRISN